jgi:UDP-N-acetylglucosamine 2-epimerase
MIEVINREKTNPIFRIVPSLEYRQFLALARETAVWIGNSSGALIESSSFKTPVVNIGTRQTGRQRGENVLDVGYVKEEIIAAIEKSLHDEAYRDMLQKVKSPWGDGKTGPRVAKILENLVVDLNLLFKQISY